MPIYDPVEQRMTLRVVYDGVACAGKTTNLRQLFRLFAAQRSSDVFSPAEMHGRTLFFDWMQIAAGVVCGFPVLCQVVSVPGQVVLTPRRKHLLASADVVVFVCESNDAGVASARHALALQDAIARERGESLPVIVQANKQDRVGALDGASVLRALGREGAPVVEAIASDGIGVVDTFVTAVRTVARIMQARAETANLRVRVQRASTAEHVLATLSVEVVDPEWMAEMLLEEAEAALLLEDAMSAMRDDGDVAAAEAASEALARDPAAASREVDAGTTPPPRPPAADVPTGFIWPAHTGRSIVRLLGIAGAATPAPDANGAYVVSAHGHVARTSPRMRYVDAEAARQALVRCAREHTQLDRLLAPETVLVAQTADDGACWIWSVMPELPTLAKQLEASAPASLLTSYGSAVVEALRCALRHGFSVDFGPESFALQGGALRYVGEISSDAPNAHGLSAAIYRAADALVAAGADVTVFLDAFQREQRQRLTPDERAKTGERLCAVIAKVAEPS